MSQNVNPKTSVRQLASGQMENMRKQFENAAEGNDTKPIVSPKKVQRSVSSVLPNNGNTPSNQDIARKRIENVIGNGSKPVISPKRIPPKLVSNVSQNVENSKNNTELKSTQEQILQKRRMSQESCPSPAINKLVQNFNEGSQQNNVKLKPVQVDRDLVQLRTSISRVTPLRPVSVAERTKLFESKDDAEETVSNNSPNVTSLRPPTPVKTRSRQASYSSDAGNEENIFKRTPTAKPRSRPVSSSNEVDVKDAKPVPPIKPRSRPPSQVQDDEEYVNNYGALWESGEKVSYSAPVKPPRTGAHDNYMKLKIKNLKEKPISTSLSQENENSNHYEMISNNTIKTSPVYRRINKSESENTDDSKKRPPPPTRPPPPKDRPVTMATSNVSHKSYSLAGMDKHRPEIPKKPPLANNSPLYEELENVRFDINKIKHWDLPKDNLPESNMKRSYSAECLSRESLLDDPVYVDPIKVNFRDDTEFDVYVDPSGYAVPYRHKRLQQRSSTPGHSQKRTLHRQLSLEIRPISQAIKCKMGNLRKRIFHPDSNPGNISREKKVFDISKNKKKLQSVKMKINVAFAIMRKAKKTEEDGGQNNDTSSIESDSLVDEKEIEKRKDYCSIVRMNTAKIRKDKKQVQAVTYPQLFDFALVVGLEPIHDGLGYKPYIIYKFPEQVESNISIPQFCFPDAGEFDAKTASPAAPSESFSFVLTNIDGRHVYGYCKRLVPLDTRAGLPEVICIVSPVDAFSMYNDLLDELEDKRRCSLTMAKELIVAAFGRPMPDPGKLVHVRTLDENWETGVICLARPQDDRVDNVNRETLLSKLGVDKIVKLFSVMLLERSILFCAKSLGILSQTIHAMRSLLYPFSWPHTYIPVLPDTMLDICCSPTPYIIGILSSHLKTVLSLPLSEIFIFDLDKRQIIRSQGDEDTLLPKHVQKALKTVLNMCKVDGDLKNAQNLLISEAFLRFFIEAIGHYSSHVTTQQNEQVVFEKDGFVTNAQSPSMEQFLEWFTETQMFEVFLTEKVETNNKTKSNTLNIFNIRIKEYNEELEEAKKDKKKSKGFLKLLK